MLTSLLALALAQVPLEAGDRAKAIATQLVARHAPREAGTRNGALAQDWVADALAARGWPAERLNTYPGAITACQAGRTSRVALFLAHTDTVAGVPGGNDNAAAVGVLLTAAELLRGVDTERTICLGFPDAEEIGLVGSESLRTAADRGALGGAVDQVMALDLVGVGTLTHTGIGPAFGERRITALLAAAPADVPWVYRAVSHARPNLERSDHRPFTLAGIPATHLMARGPHGFDWKYHSEADTPDRLEPATLHAAVRAVVGVAVAPSLPTDSTGTPAFVVPSTHVVMPGWLTWCIFALALLAWVASCSGPRPERADVQSAIAWSAHAVVATVALGLTMFLALGFRRMDLALASPVCFAGWAAWAAAATGAPVEWSPRVARALGGGVTLALALWLAWVDAPLLGLPLAVAAAGVGLSRWVPAAGILAAWPAAYLFRPDAIRELHFHRLFPAEVHWWTALAGILLLPVLASIPAQPHRHRRNLALLLAMTALMATVLAWFSPESAAPMVDWR